MVVQIHPWRLLKEGEPARCGHPFEAGGATETSLGIKTSVFRILEREPSEARHVLETRWVGRPPAVEHDHLSPPIWRVNPGQPGRRLESERTGLCRL